MLKTNKVYYIILFFLFLFHGICNYIWLSQNQMPPLWDEGRYLLMGLKYKDLFSRITSFNFRSFAEIGGYYPPLFPISSLLLTIFWGNSIRTMVMVNSIYMAIMLLSVFKIGERIFDRKTGLWAAFILSMFPIVFGTSRMFLLDYALIAMIALSVYLLLLTDYFRNTKYSILFGISLGIGMLIKNTFPGFIIGPLFYIFYRGMLESTEKERRKRIANLFYSLSIGVVLALPWYVLSFPFARWKLLPLFKLFLSGFRLNFLYLLCVGLLFILLARNKIFRPFLFLRRHLWVWVLIFCFFLGLLYLLNRWVLINILWYFLGIRDQIGSVFFILFILGCYCFLFRRMQNMHVLLLGLWIIIPYFLGFFFTKQHRYTMPFLPSVALIIAGGIRMLNSPQARKYLLSCVLAFSLLHFSFFLYPITAGRFEKLKRHHGIIAVSIAVLGISPSWLFHPPLKGDAKISEILQWIGEDAKKKEITVGLIVDHDVINPETLSYYTFLNKMPIKIKGYVNVPEPKSAELECFQSDYIITLSNPKAFNWEWLKKTILKLRQLLKENSNFVLVKEFKMPFYMSGLEPVGQVPLSLRLSPSQQVLYIYKKVDSYQNAQKR